MKLSKRCVTLLCLFILLNSTTFSQCEVFSKCTESPYSVRVTITPTAIIPVQATCDWYYEYDIAFDYNIEIIGNIPKDYCGGETSGGSLFDLRVKIYSIGGRVSEYSSLPRTGGSGSALATGAASISSGAGGIAGVYDPPYVNCADVSLPKFQLSKVEVYMQGPGIYSAAGGENSDSIINCSFSPLPITLTRFYGESSGDGTQIYWTTASERDNDYFTLARSLDAENFEIIDTIPGAGNTFSTREYSLKDKQAKQGVNYYRLSQTDFSGASETFDIIAVNYTGKSTYETQVFPNPIQDEYFTLSILHGELENLSYSINSMDGRKIDSQPIDERNTKIKSPSKSGTYVLTVSKNEEKITQHKLIVF